MHPFYVAQQLDELEFFHEVCLTALYASRFVKFAAVLDNIGRLIIAKYRKGIQNYWRSTEYHKNYYRSGPSYIFYNDHIIPAIKKRRFYSLNPSNEGQQEEAAHFRIIEIDDKLRLAVAPLNETEDKYLCIYIESSAPKREIISKLRNAVI
jgi:hypothetical protein